MAYARIGNLLAVAVCFLSCVAAQDQVEVCYGPGSVVGAVIGTLIVTLGLLAAGLLFYKCYWKTRKGKHLMLVTDAENPNDQYAFDNPCFREAIFIKHDISDEKKTSRLEKNKWLGWTPLNSFGKKEKSDKVTSLDDSCVNDSRLKVVTLKSHDFTGLGFNICGNMRDGIFIKDVLHRGPAFESGCINSGDRIDSICISFRNMVFEDALTILSYASPYDVQVQVENDSYSRPSTLIRSKRESHAVSSTEKIQHPKYNRSQSISHLNEIGKTSSKRLPHQIDFMLEKNRINQSLNKSHESHGNTNDYPTIKLTAPSTEAKKERQKLEKNAVPKLSPFSTGKRMTESDKSGNSKPMPDSQNKLQKFGIKVLPNNSGTPGTGKQSQSDQSFENEINSSKEKSEVFVNSKRPRCTSPADDTSRNDTNRDEIDGGKDNVKTMLTKGFQNLKEKINQNSLGKKKNKDEVCSNDESSAMKKINDTSNGSSTSGSAMAESDGPAPRLRSGVTCGIKAYEKVQQSHFQATISAPEEVSKAGDVARNNRKSLSDAASTRKSVITLSTEFETENEAVASGKDKSCEKRNENRSDSESSSDRDSLKGSNDIKKIKKCKGKAPAPPNADPSKEKSSSKQLPIHNESSEGKIDSESSTNEKTNTIELIESSAQSTESNDPFAGDIEKESLPVAYDSDSDTDLRNDNPKDGNIKIELNATQVTVHHSPTTDRNEDIEPGRKAASLGDLSKLDSEQPLSVVLERAVSLDLADGASQCGKKRKAPLPPSEEFPAVFDDLNYQKEPRLEHSLGLNTFQRRLKKSSDFGTLEDAFHDGPKSLEIEINKCHSPVDMSETHSSNIQEFSSWLAECRKPKPGCADATIHMAATPGINSTSLVNINSTENIEKQLNSKNKEQFYMDTNVSFSVNGTNMSDMQANESQNVNYPGTNSKTVVVISQPNSLNPTIVETLPMTYPNDKNNPTFETSQDDELDGRPQSLASEQDTIFEHFATATESTLECVTTNVLEEDETPPKLPSSPMPIMNSSGTISPHLTSTLTYVTEIKVSTSQKEDDVELDPSRESESTSSNSTNCSTDRYELDSVKLMTSTPVSKSTQPNDGNTITKRIQQFDIKPTPPKPFLSPIKSKPTFGFAESKNNAVTHKKENQPMYESSKIPIKTMKSETGQKVLATIQSLAAKESPQTKIPEVEYAKRVASLFSGRNSLERNNHVCIGKQGDGATTDGDTSQPNVSGFYLKGPDPSPNKKDLFSTRRVPPTVPPRKTETSLSNKSTVTVELTDANNESESSSAHTKATDKSISDEAQEQRNIVTFSSFVPKIQTDNSPDSPFVSFKIKEQEEINGKLGQDDIVHVKTSATKILLEGKDKDTY